MRKKYNILYTAMALLALMVSSCKEDGYLADGNYKPSLRAYYLNADAKDFSKTADAQTWETKVYAGENSWQFKNFADWIQMSPNSGVGEQNVSFTVTANPSGISARQSIFDLQSTEADWDYRTSMSINQMAAEQMVCLKENGGKYMQLNLSGKAESKDVDLETNCASEISWSCSQSWLTATYSREEKRVHIEAAENTTSDNRYATITIRTSKNSNSYVTIDVYQAPANITVSDKTSLVFENTGGTYELEINSEAAWTVSNTLSWLDVSPSTGGVAGVSKLKVTANPNTDTSGRSGSFYLYIGYHQAVKITVEQQGVYIDAGEHVYNLSSSAQTYDFEVNSNVSWTVQSSSDWLTVSPTSGLAGKTKVTATISDDPSIQGRIGWLIFTADGLAIQTKKNFNQSGKTFEVGAKQISFGDKESTQTVEITSEAAWTAKKRDDYDWFSISPESADGNGTLNITVQANNTTEERFGYIDVTMYDKTETIVVHQGSKYFTVSASELEFTSLTTSSLVEISTNDAWKARVVDGVDWLTLDPTEGEGDCKMKVSIADNPSTKSREGSVEVTSLNTGNVTMLNYRQAARFLRASCADLPFFAKGGTSEVVYISSDAQFEITQEGSWFSVNRIDDYTFTVTATPNNTDDERTGKVLIKATDLKEGELLVEIPLRQIGKNSTFIKGDFSSDDSWDLIHNSTATIKVVKFTADKSWDVNTQSNGKISFSAYGEDSNWDLIKKSNTTITGNGYGKDGNWNTNNSSTDNISGKDYDKDGNWNTNNGSTGNIGGNSYAKDDNWNTNNSSKGNISGTNFGKDNDWNNNK